MNDKTKAKVVAELRTAGESINAAQKRLAHRLKVLGVTELSLSRLLTDTELAGETLSEHADKLEQGEQEQPQAVQPSIHQLRVKALDEQAEATQRKRNAEPKPAVRKTKVNPIRKPPRA